MEASPRPRAPSSVRADGALGRRKPGPLGGGQAWRRRGHSGLQRIEGSGRAARRGGLGGGARGMTTPATCKPDCLRWGPPPLAKQEWGVEVDRGGGGGEIRRPDGARPRRRRPARELAARRRTASTRGRQPGWRRWRAERGRAWAKRRGRPEGGAGGRPGLTQLRRRAGELRAPTPGSYSRATPRLGARSGPAGRSPAPMGACRALAPPRDRPRNSSHGGGNGGGEGRGPWARGCAVGVRGPEVGVGGWEPQQAHEIPGTRSKKKIEALCHVSGVPCACATGAHGVNQRAWHPRPQL